MAKVSLRQMTVQDIRNLVNKPLAMLTITVEHTLALRVFPIVDVIKFTLPDTTL